MPQRILQRLGAFLLLLLAAGLLAGAYGAVHDQLSYTISPEYFTRYKFEQFARGGVGPLSGRFGAAVVGALATWWVGVFAGVVIGVVGLAHRKPAVMLRTSLWAFGVVAAVALASGLVGLVLASFGVGQSESGWFRLWRPGGLEAPRAFVAVGMMHNASYLGGAAGILAAVVLQVRWALRERLRRASGAPEQGRRVEAAEVA